MTDRTSKTVAEIVRHTDLLLESGDEVAHLTPDEWRRIKEAIGTVETTDWRSIARARGEVLDKLSDQIAALKKTELTPEEPPEQLPLSSAKSTRRDMDRWFDGKPEKTTATLYETGWLPEHNAQPPPPEKAK